MKYTRSQWENKLETTMRFSLYELKVIHSWIPINDAARDDFQKKIDKLEAKIPKRLR